MNPSDNDYWVTAIPCPSPPGLLNGGHCLVTRGLGSYLEQQTSAASRLPGVNAVPPIRPQKGLHRQICSLFFSSTFSDFLGDFDPGESDSRSLGQT